jgi:uncharacterized protein (DUF2141 family)
MTLKLRYALAAVGLAFAAAPQAHADTAVRVTVTVTRITAPQGFMMVALHNERGWAGAPVARARVPVTGNSVTLTLEAPAPGRYAIKLFHDVNGDGKMETNMLGIPTEPVGFSNDAPIRLGPPRFADAGFDVGAGGAAQTITLN